MDDSHNSLFHTCQHFHMRLRELFNDIRVGGNGESRFERQRQRGAILPHYYSVYCWLLLITAYFLAENEERMNCLCGFTL